MSIKIKTSERGFIVGEFVDRYGARCSIQESSLAEESCIWLGCDSAKYIGDQSCVRMHLTQEMAADLLPLLAHFVKTGSPPNLSEP